MAVENFRPYPDHYQYQFPQISFEELVAQTSFLASKPITDFFVYIGKFAEGDQRHLADIMISLALYYKKPDSSIHLVGCRCDYRKKQLVASQNGFDLINCECKGGFDLTKILKLHLKLDTDIICCPTCHRYMYLKTCSDTSSMIEVSNGKRVKIMYFRCGKCRRNGSFSIVVD